MIGKITLFFLLLLSSSAWALRLEYIGETEIATDAKFKKALIGGISGIAYEGQTLYALSDDRGRYGEPRFFSFDLKIEKKAVSLTAKEVRYLTGFAEENKPSLDPEGLVHLFDGDFLISSEGNNDRKPRQMPRIFRTNATGKWKADLFVPEKFLPETMGRQTKGIQNNSGFEGLTRTFDGKMLFVATEAPLIQDFFKSEEKQDDWIRILKYETQNDEYKPTAEFAYRLDPLKSDDKSQEVFRGVSEILAVSETKLLVLERGVRVSAKNIWAATVILYLVDVTKGTNVAGLPKLSDGKFTGLEKIKLLDFDSEIPGRASKITQNFEALAWGPKLADGRRSLLVMVDNNFSKKEHTELLVFAVEGE